MLVAYEQDVPRRQALAIQYKFLPTCFSHLLDVSLQLQGEGGALDTPSQELVLDVAIHWCAALRCFVHLCKLQFWIPKWVDAPTVGSPVRGCVRLPGWPSGHRKRRPALSIC